MVDEILVIPLLNKEDQDKILSDIEKLKGDVELLKITKVDK